MKPGGDWRFESRFSWAWQQNECLCHRRRDAVSAACTCAWCVSGATACHRPRRRWLAQHWRPLRRRLARSPRRQAVAAVANGRPTGAMPAGSACGDQWRLGSVIKAVTLSRLEMSAGAACGAAAAEASNLPRRAMSSAPSICNPSSVRRRHRARGVASAAMAASALARLCKRRIVSARYGALAAKKAYVLRLLCCRRSSMLNMPEA